MNIIKAIIYIIIAFLLLILLFAGKGEKSTQQPSDVVKPTKDRALVQAAFKECEAQYYLPAKADYEAFVPMYTLMRNDVSDIVSSYPKEMRRDAFQAGMEGTQSILDEKEETMRKAFQYCLTESNK
jgi:hypothetical protein